MKVASISAIRRFGFAVTDLADICSLDPLGLVDGASVYGYALQNPGRFSDFRGEFAEDGYLAALAALVAADAVTPDPSDAAAIPKVALYCVAALFAIVASGLTARSVWS